MNIIKTAKELDIDLAKAEEQIKNKRKFLSETFKLNSGGMGLSGSSRMDDDDEW